MSTIVPEILTAARVVQSGIDTIVRIHRTDPTKEYLDFKSDIGNLDTSLRGLHEILQKAHHTVLAGPPSRQVQHRNEEFEAVSALFGDFQRTIQECEVLIKGNASFKDRRSFAAKTQWRIQKEEQVQVLRSRLNAHAFKLNLLVKPLNQELEARARDQLDRLEARVHELSEDQRRDRSELRRFLSALFRGERDPEEVEQEFENRDQLTRRASPTVPEPIRTLLKRSYRDMIASSTGDPQLEAKIDAFHYHFERSTLTFKKITASGAVQPSIDQYLNLLKSIFLINRIRVDPTYVAKAKVSGLWIRWFEELETQCVDEQTRFPPTDESPIGIQALLVQKLENYGDVDLTFWQKAENSFVLSELELRKYILQVKLDGGPQNEKREIALLQSTSGDQNMMSMKISAQGINGKASETFPVILHTVAFVPLWTMGNDAQNGHELPTRLDATIEHEGGKHHLSFLSEDDFRRFQQALTNYNVVFDSQQLEVKEYRSRKFQPKSFGSLQVWKYERLDEEPYLPTSPQLTNSTTFRMRSDSNQSEGMQISRRQSSIGSGSPSQASRASTSGLPVASLSPRESRPHSPKAVASMIVFFLRPESSNEGSSFCLTLKLTSHVKVEVACNCKDIDRSHCGHLTILDSRSKLFSQHNLVLDKLDYNPSHGSEGGISYVNVAALGFAQRETSASLRTLETVRSVNHLNLNFQPPNAGKTRNDLMALIEREIWVLQTKSDDLAYQRMYNRSQHV